MSACRSKLGSASGNGWIVRRSERSWDRRRGVGKCRRLYRLCLAGRWRQTNHTAAGYLANGRGAWRRAIATGAGRFHLADAVLHGRCAQLRLAGNDRRQADRQRDHDRQYEMQVLHPMISAMTNYACSPLAPSITADQILGTGCGGSTLPAPLDSHGGQNVAAKRCRATRVRSKNAPVPVTPFTGPATHTRPQSTARSPAGMMHCFDREPGLMQVKVRHAT